MTMFDKTIAIVALGLSVMMVKDYFDREAQIQAVRDLERTKMENFHSAVVHRRLVMEEEAYQAQFHFPSMETMEPLARQCFKSYNCYKLAEAIYHEDRGGGMEGMKAVANVIINRVESKRFPHTIADVVNQKRKNSNGVLVCQFSYVCLKKSLKMDEYEWKIKAGWIALKAYRGNLRDRTNGADHYYNPNLVSRVPKFAKVYDQVATVSDHIFYRSTTIQ